MRFGPLVRFGPRVTASGSAGCTAREHGAGDLPGESAGTLRCFGRGTGGKESIEFVPVETRQHPAPVRFPELPRRLRARPRTPPVPSPCRSGTAARRRSSSDDRRGRAASRPRPAPGRPVRGMDQRLDPVAGPEHEPAAGSGLGPVRPRQDRANPHGRRRPSAASFRALCEAAMLPPIVTSRTVSPGRSQDHFTLQVGLAGGATRHRIDAILSDCAALIRPARDRKP